MAIDIGDRIGDYEVSAELGRGGMGEVYRARDTKLDRDVALKVLPASFASDPDRLMRFEREAKTLAALNHPNIAAIYGIGEADEDDPGSRIPDPGSRRRQFLVMELVDGEDLSERITRGPVPIEDALAIARQIADALEAAHEQGIIHRDLKPANIKVRDDGTVKVLDFGLAKALAPEGAGATADAMNSPTMTSPALTAMGLILGTAAYMAPEQAKGRPVDKRADIWAFGVVLYEMLTGRRAYEGADVTEVIAAVIKDTPDFDALPVGTPPAIRRLLARCLQRDPRARLRDIGDARQEFEEPHDAGTAAVPVPRARPSAARLVGVVAATVVLTAGATLWLAGAFEPKRPTPAPQRMAVLGPSDASLAQDPSHLAISPDGRRLAFLTSASSLAAGGSAGGRLWIRSLDDLTPRAVDEATDVRLPFWSPDSQTLGYFSGGKLMIVPASGGPPRELAPAPDGRGGTWSANGTIVFAPTSAGPLLQISENGGNTSPATELASDAGETGHRFPSFLPDGRHLLYAAMPPKDGLFEIFIGTIDSLGREFLLSAESSPRVAAPGHLLYTRKGVLVAHPFDASRRRLTGEAFPLSDRPEGVGLDYSAGWALSVADTGALVYSSVSPGKRRLAWLDQTGREAGAVDVPPGPYYTVSLSRDGRRAAVSDESGLRGNIRVVDLVRGGLTPLASTESGWTGMPVMEPDGSRVAYTSDRAGPSDLYLRHVDAGSEETLYRSPDLFKHPATWSPDGRVLVYTNTDPKTGSDIWTIGFDRTQPPAPFVRTQADEIHGALSPDGRWMAYISNQTGQFDVYVQAYPGPGTAHRLTTGGVLDFAVWWRADGRQVLTIAADRRLLLVDVKTSPDFWAGEARVVGRLPFYPIGRRPIDATPDLQRLLAIVPEEGAAGSFTVLQNWQEAIR